MGGGREEGEGVGHAPQHQTVSSPHDYEREQEEEQKEVRKESEEEMGGGGEMGTIQGCDIPIGDRDKQKRSFALNQINILRRHHSQTLDNINEARQLIQAQVVC